MRRPRRSCWGSARAAERQNLGPIQVEGGVTYEAEGNITSHEYEVRSNGAAVAQISRQWFSLRDTYGVAVGPGHDHVLMLAAAICIDEISEQEREQHR